MVTKTWVKGMLTRFFNNLHKVAISGDYNDLENKLVVNTTALNPTGTIINFFGLESQVPEGYLPCNGTEYLIKDYPILANHLAKIDTALSRTDYTGSDADHFKVPDLRGEFLRGTGTNRHSNQGNGANIGVHQDGTIHDFYYNHTSSVYGGGLIGCTRDSADKLINSWTNSWHPNSGYGGVASGATGGRGTSRPTNTSVLYCIKY